MISSSEAVMIGMPKEEIDTPALVIDLDAMEKNIATMAKYFAGQRANLRPHFKTHKCPNLSLKQVAAGAVGITCAKVEEAEALVNGGVLKNVLIANQVVDKAKIIKLMGLNKHAEVMCCVDSAKNIKDLSEAAQAYGIDLGVLVEVNVGLNRCGVDTPEEAVELARLVDRSKGLRFMGLQGYEGHLVNIADFNERKAAIEKDLARLGKARDAIEKAGLKVTVADSAGSGSYAITTQLPFVDEAQAGSYIFMDTNYQKVLNEFDVALTLLTTIISRPTKDRAITNAGMKALSNDEGAIPAPLTVTGVEVEELHEEHGVLKLHNPSQDLQVGDKIELILGHVCTTVNLHDRYYGVRNGKVEVVWPITGRGKFR